VAEWGKICYNLIGVVRVGVYRLFSW